MSVVLSHDKITLRPLKESDIRRLWELSSPETFQFMVNQIQTLEEFETWMKAGYQQMQLSDKTVIYVVADRETDEVYGSTRIYMIDYLNKSCEIGSTYYGKDFRRTHVNTTVKLMMLTYIFEKLGMIRVQFKTDEENIISQKAIERIGAKKEGILRNERIRSTGKSRNAVVYSIIHEEWPTIKEKLVQKMNIYS